VETDGFTGSLIEVIPEGIIAVDAAGRIIGCNAKAMRLLSLSKDPTGSAISALENAALQRFLGDARNGEMREFDVGGKSVSVTYRDLIQGDLRFGAVLLMSLVGERSHAERVRTEFTANVSHELKTPLTSISGYAEMISMGMAQGDDIKRFANKIETEAKRMLTLISDIIRLSQLDEMAEARLSFEVIDFYPIVSDIVELMQPIAQKRGLSIQLSGGSMQVKGDKAMLTELATNLIDNAVRYNRDNGLITVRVADQCFSVRDTGIGISKSDSIHVFERFYRADKSRSKATGGTGLGLAIVKHTCEQLGAVVSLDSREGIGTEITVRFPKV